MLQGADEVYDRETGREAHQYPGHDPAMGEMELDRWARSVAAPAEANMPSPEHEVRAQPYHPDMLPGAGRPTAATAPQPPSWPSHRPATTDGEPGLRSSQLPRREGSLRETLLKRPLGGPYDSRD